MLEAAQTDAAAVLEKLNTSMGGLSADEAKRRLALSGLNVIAAERRLSWYARLFSNIKDPLSLLLLVLGVIAYFTGDIKATAIIVIMLGISVSLRFIEEQKSDSAAEKLKAMVRTTATVFRAGVEIEAPLQTIVPGDIVHLSAGDMLPADVRIIESRDLFVNQAALTGESLPVEKHAPPVDKTPIASYDLPNICFMGTDVESGTATAVVAATGGATRFGLLASQAVARREVSSFDRGISRFTWLMIRFILVMAPVVFIINGVGKGDWLQAFLFALAVTVGLTPELLPMIVTVNLSKGALKMSRQKVIVKRLNAIQNVGAMDILCTDKTGTLTLGQVVLIKHIDIEGKANESIIDLAYLNSFYQTGFKNLIDQAVINHGTERAQRLVGQYQKIDEIPFDFIRRRLSVVVADQSGQAKLICKGAIEEVLACSRRVVVNGRVIPLKQYHHESKEDIVQRMSQEGFRLVALAYKDVPRVKRVYKIEDETDLTLLGFLAFLDPPKETAAEAIAELGKLGIRVKILTGDNELVTRKICRDVGLTIERILLGSDIESMDDQALAQAAEEATVFDKLEPLHKQRVIRALQSRGHVVGFLGDGINDAPALKTADVGLSVDSAVDIAKESSDVILLEKSLLTLRDGVREGRMVFGNIVKYIKMTASSNFGNMFSVVGASIFLPFLPMLPLQVIVNNLLYDLSQITIPTDGVDAEYIQKPRQWGIGQIQRFILWMGPVSSLFDYATFFALLYLFHAWTNPALFHTGWFVESLVSQTLIIYIIRTRRIPFLQSRPSLPLTLSSVLVVAFGSWLPFSPLAKALGFTALPALYWLMLFGFILAYVTLAQLVKRWFTRRYGWD